MTMNRFLIAIGMVSIIAGLLWPWIKKVPLFHLPGDIIIDRPGLRFYFRRLAVWTYARVAPGEPVRPVFILSVASPCAPPRSVFRPTRIRRGPACARQSLP